MKRLFVIIAALGLGLAGCASGGGGGPGNEATILVAGSHGYMKDQKAEQAHSVAEFKALWDANFQGDVNPPKMPDVDFTKNTVVGYFMGEMKNTGYILRVDSAGPSTAPGAYDVNFLVIRPGPNCEHTTNEHSHPFLFASVPTTVQISMDERTRDTPPCG